MGYSTKISKDLKDVEVKFMFNLTKRQFGFTFLGGILGLVSFLVTKQVNITIAIISLLLISIPIMSFGFIKINKVPLEKHLYNHLYRVKNSKVRLYKRENNFYILCKKFLKKGDKN